MGDEPTTAYNLVSIFVLVLNRAKSGVSINTIDHHAIIVAKAMPDTATLSVISRLLSQNQSLLSS